MCKERKEVRSGMDLEGTRCTGLDDDDGSDDEFSGGGALCYETHDERQRPLAQERKEHGTAAMAAQRRAQTLKHCAIAPARLA